MRAALGKTFTITARYVRTSTAQTRFRTSLIRRWDMSTFLKQKRESGASALSQPTPEAAEKRDVGTSTLFTGGTKSHQSVTFRHKHPGHRRHEKH